MKNLLTKLNEIKANYETAWAIRKEGKNLIVCLIVCKKKGINKYKSIKSFDIVRIKHEKTQKNF